MRHGRRWTDGEPAGEAEDRPATGADPEASSLHARLQSAWEAPLLADTNARSPP